MVEIQDLCNQLASSQPQGSSGLKAYRGPSGNRSPEPGIVRSPCKEITPVPPVTVCENTLDVYEADCKATAGVETRPTQYCLPTRITEILMNPAILELHVIRQIARHSQLHLRVRGMSSAGEEQIFEISLDTRGQVRLKHEGLLSARSLQRSTALVALRGANGKIMEGGLHEADISLEIVCHKQLLHRDLGQRHQTKGLFYRSDLPAWDTIMGFQSFDIVRAKVLPHRCTLLLEEGNQLSWLSTSMEPESSPWDPAERGVLAQAVRSLSMRLPTADTEVEYGLSESGFQGALGEYWLSTQQVDVFRSAALRKLPTVGTKEDWGWKRCWGSHLWNLL